MQDWIVLEQFVVRKLVKVFKWSAHCKFDCRLRCRRISRCRSGGLLFKFNKIQFKCNAMQCNALALKLNVVLCVTLIVLLVTCNLKYSLNYPVQSLNDWVALLLAQHITNKKVVWIGFRCKCYFNCYLNSVSLTLTCWICYWIWCSFNW